MKSTAKPAQNHSNGEAIFALVFPTAASFPADPISPIPPSAYVVDSRSWRDLAVIAISATRAGGARKAPLPGFNRGNCLRDKKAESECISSAL
jgi:hypothetical protein